MQEDRFRIRLRNASSLDSQVATALTNFLKGNINRIVDKLIVGLNQQL